VYLPLKALVLSAVNYEVNKIIVYELFDILIIDNITLGGTINLLIIIEFYTYLCARIANNSTFQMMIRNSLLIHVLPH